MPTPTLTINGRKVNTEDALIKLLQLANDFRAALGADSLKELPKSRPGDAKYCVIANALNFDSNIHPGVYRNLGTATFYNYEHAERFIELTEQSDVRPTRAGRLPDGRDIWMVPLTPELNEIAKAFDRNELPELVE